MVHFILAMLNRDIDIDCSVRISNFLINIFEEPTKKVYFLKSNFASFLHNDMIKTPSPLPFFLIFQNNLDKEM